MSAKAAPKPVYAVLTGDIIDSVEMRADHLRKVRDALRDTVDTFSNSGRGPVEAHLDMYRGDAWQILLTDHALALRLALLLQAQLRTRLDAGTRIAIGLGGAEAIDPDKVSLSIGEAFTLSGRALEQMTGYFDLTAALPLRAGDLSSWVPATFHLCSELVRSWTRRQAEIVSLGLIHSDDTHEDLAARLEPPVSKQAVTAALGGANWRGLQEALRVFETTDWKTILHAGPESD